MTRKIKHIKTNVKQEQLTDEWQERALEASKQFNVPMPTNEAIGSPEEVEKRLRLAEQEGGE